MISDPADSFRINYLQISKVLNISMSASNEVYEKIVAKYCLGGLLSGI